MQNTNTVTAFAISVLKSGNPSCSYGTSAALDLILRENEVCLTPRKSLLARTENKYAFKRQ